MAEESAMLPMGGGGGLLRYYNESKSKLQIKPMYVILFIVLTLIFYVFLKSFIKA